MYYVVRSQPAKKVCGWVMQDERTTVCAMTNMRSGNDKGTVRRGLRRSHIEKTETNLRMMYNGV